jgi:hypothetical protein
LVSGHFLLREIISTVVYTYTWPIRMQEDRVLVSFIL